MTHKRGWHFSIYCIHKSTTRESITVYKWNKIFSRWMLRKVASYRVLSVLMTSLSQRKSCIISTAARLISSDFECLICVCISLFLLSTLSTIKRHFWWWRYIFATAHSMPKIKNETFNWVLYYFLTNLSLWSCR